MARAMARLAGDPALRAAMRQAGLDQAKTFSWAQSAANAVKTFMSV